MLVNICSDTVLRTEIEGVAPQKVLMRIFHFAARLWLPRPRIEVFDFFSNASNLEAIPRHGDQRTGRMVLFKIIASAALLPW
jgi:hypothetical protein